MCHKLALLPGPFSELESLPRAIFPQPGKQHRHLSQKKGNWEFLIEVSLCWFFLGLLWVAVIHCRQGTHGPLPGRLTGRLAGRPDVACHLNGPLADFAEFGFALAHDLAHAVVDLVDLVDPVDPVGFAALEETA